MADIQSIIDKHKSDGRRVCYAESLGPVTVKHEFSSDIRAVALRCTQSLGHNGNHRDGNCCWATHDFTPEMAGPPEPDHRITEKCVECHETWPCDVALIAESIKDQPVIEPPKFPLSATWKVGERVEYVRHHGPGGTRPGVVTAIKPNHVTHERLIVTFDDNGETRPINPDVMRHIKED